MPELGTKRLTFIPNECISDHVPLFENYAPDISLPVRYSMDQTISPRGQVFNDLCVQTGLRILNGRAPGDFVGKLTYHTPKGSSVVDYGVASQCLIPDIKFFTVHRFLADLSDHCQISLLLKVNFTHEENNKNLPLMPDKYIWDKESGPEFQTTLASIPFQDKIKSILDQSFENSDMMVDSLNSIICQAADISIKKVRYTDKNIKSKQNKKQNKLKWFDQSLVGLRRQLEQKQKLLDKYRRGPQIRGSFFSLLKK